MSDLCTQPPQTPGPRGLVRRQRHHPREAEGPTGGAMDASAPRVRQAGRLTVDARRPTSANTAAAAGTQPTKHHPRPERTPCP